MICVPGFCGRFFKDFRPLFLINECLLMAVKILIGIVAFFFGISYGLITVEDKNKQSCNTFGTIQIDNALYICKKIK